ncbi:DUF429 domain-containing protein [Pseudacidovorax intermedius]|uniref:DUF429 domain-containing protein n=1 Tax=Pseudacidovorax intermedius TaxID=433924 RepID=A0A147GUZ6_9BURK|nr:DUF429 domain-containing protein [Pseudacidovorax intermedius]KTT21432.1 hypothetical protein NS331_12230 [Pseudacidovorax intermedius]
MSGPGPARPRLLGCDFSSTPSRRKPIVLAWGRCEGNTVMLEALERFPTLSAWTGRLAQVPAWIGGFDFPFGLPREFVIAQGWPLDWAGCMATYTALGRAELRERFVAFCAARPVGGKFAHRAADRPAGSSPSMKWVNPPVAWMMHAGVPGLLAAGAWLPGQGGVVGAPRVALEAYPGLVARDLLGARSYKSDERAKQTPQRQAARVELLHRLGAGEGRLGLRLQAPDALGQVFVDDASGDALDAALCLMLAAWGEARAESEGPGFGLPARMDPLEGWIVGA